MHVYLYIVYVYISVYICIYLGVPEPLGFAGLQRPSISQARHVILVIEMLLRFKQGPTCTWEVL